MKSFNPAFTYPPLQKTKERYNKTLKIPHLPKGSYEI